MHGEPNYGRELRSYLVGCALTLVLTLAAFAVGGWGGHKFAHGLVLILGMLQLLVHL